jgi:hypothetical protein
VASGVIALAALSGCAEAVPAPKAFVAYSSKDGRFACDYPKGWQAEGGGNTDYSWAKFTAGGAEIRIDTDIAGSAMGDIVKAQGAMMGDKSGFSPVAEIHNLGIRHMKEAFSNYTEREPKPFQSSGFGEGRRSTFIADQTLGGKVYGYRATLLGGDRRLTVVCSCPATNFETLKSAFDKVITSLRVGGR